jgi:tetratricopeptide (TPR) repeat protein
LNVFIPSAFAEEDIRQHLKECLKKADNLPDMAAADADTWFKHGGGDAARLCRATAQFNRNEFAKSAQDFSALADTRKDPKRAALLHAQAGLAWMRAKSFKRAEAEYEAGLRKEPDDPDIWVDRATERAAAQRYWDAIADLNKALDIMPDMPEALRLRGQVWYKLGVASSAKSDFERAVAVEGGEQASKDQATAPTQSKKSQLPPPPQVAPKKQ